MNMVSVIVFCIGSAFLGFLLPEFLLMFSRRVSKVPLSMNLLCSAGCVLIVLGFCLL